MADETTEIAEHDPLPEVAAVAEAQPQDDSAAGRLRAFEDKVFGADAVRIDGKVERGSGSPFQTMNKEQREHYRKLEQLIEAEQALADAQSAVVLAEVNHKAALAAVE